MFHLDMSAFKTVLQKCMLSFHHVHIECQLENAGVALTNGDYNEK